MKPAPYVVEKTFLPASSTVPERGSGLETDVTVRETLVRLSRRYVSLAIALQSEFTSRLLPLHKVTAQLGNAGNEIAPVCELLSTGYPLLSLYEEHTGRENQLRILGRLVTDERITFEYVVYDEYFDVVRVPNLSFDTFLCQMALTARAVLFDVPWACIGLDDIIALLRALESMFTLAVGFVSDSHTAPPSEHLRGTGLGRLQDVPTEVWKAFWDDDSPDVAHLAATYRWKVGHHYFALCMIWCQHALQRAKEAVGQDAAAVALFLDRAATLLRGSTAAMWYASNFPAEVYRKDIRPQMEATDTRGFSGTQNYDYALMKAAKAELLNEIRDFYGETRREWKLADRNVADLSKAVIRFLESDLEDAEQHTLLAALRVGRSPSLLQLDDQPEEAVEDSAGSSEELSALEMLRELAERRRLALETFAYNKRK